MKFAARLFVLAVVGIIGSPPMPAAAAPGNARASGRAYVRLSDWARANRFDVRSPDRGKTLQLSNRWTNLSFNTDPRQDLRRASINGTGVWLAFPIRLQNGTAYISQVDLEKSLTPALSPPASPRGVKIKTICLDAGHGGTDPGFRVGSNEEKKYTLLLSQEVREQLKASGFTVVPTRSTDVKVPLESRIAAARQSRADLFVSLHFNAFPPVTEVKGVEVYCCTPAGATSFNSGGEGDTRGVAGNRNDEKNFLLAYQVQRAIVKNLQIEDRGIKRARYLVLREATMPAILIEGGFMSNPAEGRKIYDPAWRRQMARAIVEGVLAYQGGVKG
jgi:N-acetylmuramoyl-L-alanine amidase